MLKEGDVVWLKEDKSEGWSREQATVLDTYPNGVILVEVLVKQNRCDDGLREITKDQIESENICS